jgi:membrane associated rhomboid family serine protease
MVQAPVGHHCPDCVKQGNKGMRRISMQPTAVGVVCKALVALNVVAYVIQLADPNITARFADQPASVASGQYYRMLTAAFLHASILHIAFNMGALYIFGSQVERAIGAVRFLALYLLAAVGGSLGSLLFAPRNLESVGASGAIFGLLGAYLVIARRRGMDTRPIVGLVVIELLLGAANPVIDNRAHVGGLITGLAVALGFGWAERYRGSTRTLIQGGVVVAMAAVIVVLTITRTGQLNAAF